MKNKISILVTAFVLSLGFNACTDDDNLRFQTVENPDQITFTNNFLSEYVLSNETANNNAERFIWASPDFGAPTAINYFLEASLEGTFEEGDVEVFAGTSETQSSVSVGQLIGLAEEKGLSNVQVEDDEGNPVFDENGDPVFNNVGELFFRVRADVGDDVAENSPETTSAVQIINVRLLLAATGEDSCSPAQLPQLFLVGNATSADWNNNNNNIVMLRNPDNENQFSFTGRFLGEAPTNEFKFLEVRGQWQPQWGIDGGNFTSSDILGGDPSNFVTDGATGYYTVEADKEALTYSMTPFDASAAPTYTSISIIGESTPLGWDGDTEMTQSAFDVHQWYINDIELIAGEMKIRTTGDWTTNWGDSTALSGTGTQDGPNIPVEDCGTFTIWFNDLNGSYMFVPVAE
jgi:hypothetical protein